MNLTRRCAHCQTWNDYRALTCAACGELLPVPVDDPHDEMHPAPQPELNRKQRRAQKSKERKGR